MNEKGSFTVSLDMELYWGMRDIQNLDTYGENIRNAHNVIPQILELFEKYQIHATWAIVGFLFFKDKKELLPHLPANQPGYLNELFNPYPYLINNDLEKKCHFAPDLISLIHQTPHQEIGTHTYSHYFTLETGQTIEQFRADLEYAKKIHDLHSVPFRSIVFPRNQFSEEHLSILNDLGIHYFRGNSQYWLYRPRKFKSENAGIRMMRLADAYLNLSGHNTFSNALPDLNKVKNIPASHFLRPYTPGLKMLESLRFHRIKKAMQHAAKNNENYHIWWHPHNFGKNTRENLVFLEKILKQYYIYQFEYGFTSKSMSEY